MSEQKATGQHELLGDFRPGFTLWSRSYADFEVLVTQLEGGALLGDDITSGLEALKEAILSSQQYVTLYDLTLVNFEATSLLPHAVQLIGFASEMRQQSEEKQRCMVAICTDERARNWIRWILGLLPYSVNFHIFRDAAQAWAFVAGGCCVDRQEHQDGGGCSYDSFGAEASVPQTVAGVCFDYGFR